jgi:hypothetical protein
MNEKLRNEIARKLHKMEQNLADAEKVRLRWLFIDKFIRCEVAVKKVMTAYKKSRNGDKDKGFERLDMRTIPAALDWAGFNFQKEELDELFSGSGKFNRCGTKSAKKLRDGAMHEHNENDIQEIVDRFDELNEMMDAFLNHFRWTEEEMAAKNKSKKTAKAPAVV